MGKLLGTCLRLSVWLVAVAFPALAPAQMLDAGLTPEVLDSPVQMPVPDPIGQHQPLLVPAEALVLDGTDPEALRSFEEALTTKGPLLEFGDWMGYNNLRSDMTWLAAGNDVGMFSLQSYPSIPLGDTWAIETGMGFHFVDGPANGTADLPPRLFDAEIAFRSRSMLSDSMMLDVRLGVGVFSDFEGSARKGVRYPGHVVTYYDVAPGIATVLGIDVLDRDDISLLPVAGMVLRPHRDFVLEMVFPRPRIQYRFTANKALYTSMELGGSTWAIERADYTNDVATYRDLRLAVGIMDTNDPRSGVFEIGMAFDRDLEYRSGRGDYAPDDTIFFRIRRHF